MLYKKENIEITENEGILYIKYLPDNAIIDLELAKKIVRQRHEFTNGKKYPVIVDTTNLKTMNTDARTYWAKDECISDILIGAIIVDQTVGNIIGNWYLQVSKPKVPARLFKKIEDAEKWIKQELQKEDLV